MIEEQTQCLLVRTLKLMCPFGSSEGDLKKNQKHSASSTATISLLIKLNPQVSSMLFRLQGSQIPCAHVLKMWPCAGRMRECHTAVKSDSVVEY